MKVMSKKIPTVINPLRFYSLGEIVRECLIPDVDSVQKASRLVRNDLIFGKILKAQPSRSNAGHVSYQVMGANIINYLVFKEDQEKWQDRNN